MKNNKYLKRFVEKANKIFNNKYKYSEYSGAHIKISIRCPNHGSFIKTPSDHLKGSGCPSCKKEDKLNSLVEKFNKIHANKYDYPNINSEDIWKNKLKVNCPDCGEFTTTARLHLKGSGCPTCRLNFNKDHFIKLASLKHNNKYDYSDIEYTNIFKSINLKCKQHGLFSVLAMNHLHKGAGCPRCIKYGFSLDKPATLYYIYDPESNMYKIGITNKTIEERFGKAFCSERAIAILEQTAFKNGQDAYLAEQEILEAFSYARCVNESWPESKGGRTEFFNRDILKLNKDNKCHLNYDI